MGNKALVKTRHSTKFDGAQVARDLAAVVKTFDQYKAMGDAMAQVNMSRDDVMRFFGEVLEIPAGSKQSDKDSGVSTRKWNTLRDLEAAFAVTQRERNTNEGDAWSALQAVTRYVDHDRSVRGAGPDGTPEVLSAMRFDSGTFGSGDALKGRALGILMPLIQLPEREKVLVRA
jgi:hypothetical protein